MRRASPLIRLSALDKTNVGSAESAPAETAAISLVRTGHTFQGGQATAINAPMPDKEDYRRLEFSFEDVTITGSPTAVQLTLWTRTGDGVMVEAGRSAMDANGQFPSIQIENFPARYALSISTITGGASPTVSFKTYVQGIHTPTFVEQQ